MTENERIKLVAIAWVTNGGTLENFNWVINRIRFVIKELEEAKGGTKWEHEVS